MTLLKIITLLLAILGAPLFLVISALALISFSSVDIDLSVVVIEMSRLADTPMLISLPLNACMASCSLNPLERITVTPGSTSLSAFFKHRCCVATQSPTPQAMMISAADLWISLLSAPGGLVRDKESCH